jgi:hypothetical protein
MGENFKNFKNFMRLVTIPPWMSGTGFGSPLNGYKFFARISRKTARRRFKKQRLAA